jgi:hypothetical protein
MDRPLRDHISYLEIRLRELNREIMENRRSQEERNRLESEIRAANLALSYYREALNLEKQIN